MKKFALEVHMTDRPPIPSVNYHLWKPCNMGCNFCFAKFSDLTNEVLPKGTLPSDESLRIVELLAWAGFDKINFAGGEPTLCPWLPDLIRRAKELDMTTSIVTNGTKLTPVYLDALIDTLDWVTLSIDSLDTEVNRRTGRKLRKGPLDVEEYRNLVTRVRERDYRLKINTVVRDANKDEDMTQFIQWAQPERWKVFQVLPMDGQNDDTLGNLTVTDEEFDAYVERNLAVEGHGIAVVPESNELMTGSYLMVDPAGRFFDNTEGHHTPSRPILKAGVHEALQDIKVDPAKFLERGGRYEW